MALQWHWDEKVGEAVFDDLYLDDPTKELTVNLYEGNAFLIFVHEYKDKDTGDDMYNVYSYFGDKEHMNMCLGLAKGYDNIFLHGGRLKKISFNKAKSRNYKQVVSALVRAFDNIEIKIYTEGDKEK